MKRFVVTGCNGYIGSHMCYELKEAYPDCHILGIDKNVKPYLRHLYDDFSGIDISVNPVYFSNKSIDCIFHFAAYISVEESERKPWEYYRNNIGSTLNIIDAAKRDGIKNFIFSSTAAVYGELKGSMFGHLLETTPCHPQSVYGNTKHICEQMLSSETDMNIIRLRYFNVAGKNPKVGFVSTSESHLISNLAKSDEITIYGTDWPTRDGTAIRDYIHVVDICRAHIRAYEYISENDNVNLVCNIGTGKGYSVKEVVDKANEILHNGEMTVRVTGRRDGDVPYLVADTTRIKEAIGFDPEYSLDDIIESMK